MTLALIAGTGSLPPHLARALMAANDVPVICEMRGFASEIDPDLPRLSFRLETLGTFLATLREAGVTRVCMAGAMQRPEIEADAIDSRTAPLVPRLIAALSKGDDGTLREFVTLFEEHGMEVVSAAEIAPELLPPPGIETQARPGDLSALLPVARGALAEMGAADLGQALVLRGTDVIAREDARGTDAMLGDLTVPLEADGASGDLLLWTMDTMGDLLGDAADWLSGREGEKAGLPGAGGVLYKAPKPGQDRRVDLPVIGLTTATKAAEAGLRGIVIEEGGVMVLDRDAVIRTLDAQDMFLAVVRP